MEIIYKATETQSYKIGTTSLSFEYHFVFSLEDRFNDLEDLFAIMDKKISLDKISAYKKVQKTLKLTGHELILAMNPVDRNRIMSHIVREVQDLVSSEEDAKYIHYYLKQKFFLSSLSSPAVCTKTLNSIANDIEHEATSLRVKDFGKDALKTKYKMSGTTTGRLTVTEGPNILTLPSSVRSSMKSRYEMGKVLQLDLISAEPYMALLYTGQVPPDDIYQHVSEVILNNKVTRKQAKLVTLSALYGQSSRNLSKSLPSSINARDVIENTKRYFRVQELKSGLKTDLRNKNFRNVLGRPVKIDLDREDLLISYFLQSSVAECSIVAFDNFIKGTNLEVVPYYVIHDALIFDADKESAEELLSKGNIEVTAGNWKFRAKVTLVSDI